MIHKEYYYLIERYLNDEMDLQEKMFFMSTLKNNSLLAKEVDLWIETDQILKKRDSLAFRIKLDSLERSRITNLLLFRTRRNAIYKYAAILLGVIFVGSFVLYSEWPLSDRRLAEKYYRPYAPPTVSRIGELANLSTYTVGLEYYNSSDFENSAKSFLSIIEKNPYDMYATFMKGISDFENQNYGAAIIFFDRILIDNRNLFIDHARWYLAMCYLLTDQHLKATEQLIIIKNSESIYNHNAIRVLRHMKQISK